MAGREPFVYGWKRTFVTSSHPMLQVLCLLTVSESPAWLRHAGRPEAAHVAECKLFSDDDLNLALLDDVEEPSNLETQPQARLSTDILGVLNLLTARPQDMAREPICVPVESRTLALGLIC